MAERNIQELELELAELRFQLEEATDTIEAIRTGMVDAFVVHGDEGHQLYTLKTADQTYRVLIERMGEGALTLNEEGTILYCNTRFADMTGLSIDKVIGKQFHQFIKGYTQETLINMIGHTGSGDHKTEEELLGANALPLPVQLSVTNLHLDEGTALSILVTDLSSQKESRRVLKLKNKELEEARVEALKLNDELEDTVLERTRDLSVSKEHFMLLANNIPQITWTNLPGGQFSFFNQRWYDYTGLAQGAAVDDPWSAVVHPDDLEETKERFLESINTGVIFETENRFRRQDGSYRWHLNRSIPLKNDHGELLFWVGTATDIDDQRKSIEKKDEFIGIASHELKTPLTSLKAYLQLVSAYKREPVPLPVKSFITKAESSLGKLQNLVNDLLDVSKIQAGKLYFSQAPIFINELIAGCVESAGYMFPEYSMKLRNSESLQIMGNSERLEQVFMNLINNAVKYSPVNKEIIISVEQDGKHAKVSVTDFGIGLSAEQQGKIFERFYRVDERNSLAGGLGMGLYISMEIVKNHKGTMGVSSKTDQGSTFYMLLPLLD